MNYTQTWFINGRCLGISPCAQERTHETYHAPRSYAWACPHCGEVWARRLCSPHTRWFFWTAPCLSCAKDNDNILATPGSVWTFHDEAFLLSLPLEVLRYEVEIVCKS